MNFDLIAFDMDQTLCYPAIEFSKVFSNVFDFELSECIEKWLSEIRFNGPLHGTEVVRNILPDSKKLIAERLTEEFSHRWAEVQLLYPGILEFLRELRAQFNGKIFILTNGPSYFQHTVARHLGIDRLVDRVFASGDECLGSRKPNPECFGKLVKAAGTHPSRSIMIGNSYEEDHMGSLRAGWKSIWVEPKTDNEEIGEEIMTPIEFLKHFSEKNSYCVKQSWKNFCNIKT